MRIIYGSSTYLHIPCFTFTVCFCADDVPASAQDEKKISKNQNSIVLKNNNELFLEDLGVVFLIDMFLPIPLIKIPLAPYRSNL